MAIETIFYTQIGSILAFIVALFILYRVLVRQKDATIESLKAKNDYLSCKLADAVANDPDVLSKSLNNRVNVLEEELVRLSKDKVKNQDEIELKEKEIVSIKEKIREAGKQIAIVSKDLAKLSCPHCGSLISERAYQSECVEHNGREIDIGHL